MGGLLLAVAACAVLAAVLVPWLLQQRHADDLATVAARHGLEYSHEDPFGCTRVAFPLFAKGHGRQAQDVVWHNRPDGLATRAFSFSYFVESRAENGHVQRQYTRFTCVMAQVDGAWPDVSITREGLLEKALDLVGLGDIELESDDFNRRFALRSPDRRFAVTLVDAGMIDFLLSIEARLAFYVKGRWMLLVSDPVPAALTPALMRVAETFVERVPRVVYELWPSPFRDEQGHPLAAGDEGFGRALAHAERAEASPWDARRAQREMVDDDRPQYDLDGHLVQPHTENPWGDQPRVEPAGSEPDSGDPAP